MKATNNRHFISSANFKMCFDKSHPYSPHKENMITKDNYYNYYLTEDPIEASISLNGEIGVMKPSIKLSSIYIDNLLFEDWLVKYHPTGINVKILEGVLREKTSYVQYNIEKSIIPEVVDEILNEEQHG